MLAFLLTRLQMPKRTPPWKKHAPNTVKQPMALSASQKDAAKQRAEEAGRRYPNLVDNMWAARLPRGAGSE